MQTTSKRTAPRTIVLFRSKRCAGPSNGSPVATGTRAARCYVLIVCFVSKSMKDDCFQNSNVYTSANRRPVPHTVEEHAAVAMLSVVTAFTRRKMVSVSKKCVSRIPLLLFTRHWAGKADSGKEVEEKERLLYVYCSHTGTNFHLWYRSPPAQYKGLHLLSVDKAKSCVESMLLKTRIPCRIQDENKESCQSSRDFRAATSYPPTTAPRQYT